MELKQVWMSRDVARKSRFALRTAGGVVGIAVLMLVLVLGGTFLSLTLGLPGEVFSLWLVLGVTVLGVALALGLGRRSVQDATVFFLTADDRLFVLDARSLARFGRNLPGFLAGARNTQALLRALADHPRLLALADEVCRVENLKENATHWVVRFQTRRPGRNTALRSCLLVKGYADEDLLLRQLERRQSWQSTLEPGAGRHPTGLMVSGGLLLILVLLCVLSHPAVGQLPRELYFPCLGAAFLAAFPLGYFVVRWRRSE